METKLIQITSGKGPEECERAVVLVCEKIWELAAQNKLKIEMLDMVKGRRDKTALSVLLKLSGHNLDAFCVDWEGSWLWVAQSPFRPFHKRKNWFVGVSACNLPRQFLWSETDIRCQSLRASGPGGQNVNKVESAVRATHLPSGISVTASDERSQVLNKKAALERLKNKLLAHQMEQKREHVQKHWMAHHLLERGNPVKTIKEPMH